MVYFTFTKEEIKRNNSNEIRHKKKHTLGKVTPPFSLLTNKKDRNMVYATNNAVLVCACTLILSLDHTNNLHETQCTVRQWISA
jgi:hypothetical protein